MVKREPIDWENVEKEYRAGQLSIRELSSRNNVSHVTVIKKAKRLKWDRDLSEKVRQRIATKIATTTTTTTTTTGLNVSEEDIIEGNAIRGADVHISIRKDIRQAKTAYDTLVGQLNEIINERKTLEAEIIEETKDDVKPHRRNKMMKAISLPSHTGVLRDMSVVLKNLVPLERQAYNLDEPGVSLNDILNALPPEFRQAVRTELGKFI